MTEAFTQYEPSQDERTMATLAHALQMVGAWIAPLVILIIRRESKFVSFHALQVLLLQICLVIFWVIFMVLWFTLIFATVFAQSGGGPNARPPIGVFIVAPFMWLLAMGGWALVLVLAILWSIKAGRGEWANYPLLGPLARRILHIP